MFSWLKRKPFLYEHKVAVSAQERGKQFAEKLDAEFKDELVSVDKIVQAIDSLYFLAMMHDGSLFKHTRNDNETDMLMESFIILKYFAHNHKHYVSPLPQGKVAKSA